MNLETIGVVISLLLLFVIGYISYSKAIKEHAHVKGKWWKGNRYDAGMLITIILFNILYTLHFDKPKLIIVSIVSIIISGILMFPFMVTFNHWMSRVEDKI